MAFVDRFSTLLARSGGGVATRGGRQTLQAIVKDLEDSGMQMAEWCIPHNLYASMEMKRKPAAPIAVQPAHATLQALDAIDPALAVPPLAGSTSS